MDVYQIATNVAEKKLSVLVVVDLLSKWVDLVSIPKDPSALEAAQLFLDSN